MIKLYNFDELKPEEILNRDIRAEKDVEDVVAVPAAEQVDSVADLTSMEQISATFSEISSEICSVAPEEAAQAMVL